jgi:hypothetical protein
VAAADEERPFGELALWFGLVRKAHIERSTSTTILIVEGVDTRREQVGVDRKLTGMERTWGGGVRMHYEETEIYADMSQPNGRMFMVRYPKVSEKMVAMRRIVALGSYEARSPENRWPVLAALTVAERTQQAGGSR